MSSLIEAVATWSREMEEKAEREAVARGERPKPEPGVLRPTPQELEALEAKLLDPDVSKQMLNLMDYEAFKAHCVAHPYDEAHLYVQEWYRRPIPSLRSQRFASFVVGSRELVRLITEQDDISLMIERGRMAYADAENHRIILPSEAFVPEAFHHSRINTASSQGASAIAIANGNICHESAHFAKSPKDIRQSVKLGMLHIQMNVSRSENRRLLEAVDDLQANSPRFPEDLSIINNVCEDLFIEDWLRREMPAYAPFLQASHEFYFSQEEVLRRLAMHALDSSEGAKLSVTAVVDALILAKNWRFTEADFWGKAVAPYIEMMRSVRGMENQEERAALAIKIWSRLRDDKELAPAESALTGAALLCFDASGKSIILDPQLLQKLLAKEAGTEESKAIARMIEELTDSLAEAALIEDISLRRDESHISQIPPTRVMDITRSPWKCPIDKRFVSLGQQLRMALTNNDVPGPAMKRGPVLVNTRLNRIITDGKIFSHRQRRKASGKDFEFCILVDCSGSMAGRKMQEAIMAGFTAFRSLRQARIRTTLFGHTSIHREGDIPVVYIFGKATDPVEEVAYRAGNPAVEGRWSGFMSNNYDGCAILKAAEIGFSEKPAKRYMFVISDGQPAGAVYGGEAAILHTKDCVKQVRQTGIDVVSITIEHGAVAVNSRIYGKEKNVATTSPLVLNELIQAIFAKHIH